MEFVGHLVKKLEVREGDNVKGHWKIAEYLLETVEMYPRKVVMTVSDGQMGRHAIWDQFIGRNVVVQFDINAKESEDKTRWFNNVTAYHIKDTNPYEQPAKVTDDAPTFGTSGGRS